MLWKKLGLIFYTDKNSAWMQTHASNPFAEQISDNIFRVYFSTRDRFNRSHIGFVDLDALKAFKPVNLSKNPVLSPGELGLFDDSGVSMGFLLNLENKKYLYYLGWNLKITVPWMNTIGLAIYNHQEDCFQKYSKAPIIDRSDVDPFSISYPSIINENGLLKMWYGSNLSWGKKQQEMEHVIKYAESHDGINWIRNNVVAINHEYENEYAVTKPCAIKNGETFQMWYSYRGSGKIDTYRIGYADSVDGINWNRKDGIVGINISGNGWDSEMICYPYVFDHDGKRFMLYNGNGYGKSGFGLAILESD